MSSIDSISRGLIRRLCSDSSLKTANRPDPSNDNLVATAPALGSRDHGGHDAVETAHRARVGADQHYRPI